MSAAKKTQTTSGSFVAGVEKLLFDVLVPKFQELCEAKGIDITVDEIAAHFQTEAPKKRATATASLIGTAASSSSSVTTSQTGPVGTCPYIITRGANKGNPCGKKCNPGNPYCNAHMKSGAAKGVASTAIAAPSKTTDTSLFDAIVKGADSAPAEGEVTLEITQISGLASSYGKIDGHPYLFFTDDVGMNMIGVIEGPGKFREPNADEIKECSEMFEIEYKKMELPQPPAEAAKPARRFARGK